MSTQILLTVPDELYQQVEKVADATRRNISDLLVETITRSFAPLPVDTNRAKMNQNVAAYKRLHPQLLKSYLGEYVAIHEGQLVDHDQDPIVLLQRMRSNYPEQVILRRRVEPIVEREIQIRHPRIEFES